jgi:hypothetical protein
VPETRCHPNFTWSKTIDIAASSNDSFGTPYLGDPFNLQWNRGVYSLSVPIKSVTNLIYQSSSLRIHCERSWKVWRQWKEPHVRAVRLYGRCGSDEELDFGGRD